MSEDKSTYAISTVEHSTAIQAARDRYNIMVEYVKSMMAAGKDYGVIQGTDKPTLLKPGAEKLNSLFELYPEFESADKFTDWGNGLFFYQYRCTLRHRLTGQIWGTGLGSCNSRESKYRYRYVASDEKPSRADADAMKARGLGKWRKINDQWVWHIRVENDLVYDLVNTIDKMAQKRSLIAATLIACNASEFFTQDLEDLGFIEAEYKEVATGSGDGTPAESGSQKEQPQAETNGKTNLYQAVVDTKLSENIHAAKKALDQCSVGYDTPEKAIAWMRTYRAWRDSGADSKDAATHANNGDILK